MHCAWRTSLADEVRDLMGFLGKLFGARSKRNSKRREGRENAPGAEEAIVVPEELTKSLAKNLEFLRGSLGRSDDIIIREFHIWGDPKLRAALIYTDGLVDRTMIDRDILRALMERPEVTKNQIERGDLIKSITRNLVTVGGVMEVKDTENIFTEILSGNSVLFVDGTAVALSINTKGGEMRGVETPMIEPTIRGSKDSFTENILTNISLVRRRLRDPNLVIRFFTVGTRSKSRVALCHIAGVADQTILTRVEKRILGIDIDGITGAGQLEELLVGARFCPFPMTFTTERPDRVAAGLLEGQIAIMMDNEPIVLLIPAVLPMFFIAASDYYHSSVFASFERLLRIIGWFLAVFLPGIYVAFASVNPDIIPMSLAITIAASREGIPYPALVEALIMQFAMELLTEASSRLPTLIGASATVVGGLIIGTAAAQAKIISNIMIIVVAATAIGTFVIPNFEASLAWRMYKFVVLALGYLFGLYGVTTGLIFLLLYLNTLNSFGVPYLSPYGPMRPEEVARDTFLRLPVQFQKKRPSIFRDGRTARYSNSPDKGR